MHPNYNPLIIHTQTVHGVKNGCEQFLYYMYSPAHACFVVNVIKLTNK